MTRVGFSTWLSVALLILPSTGSAQKIRDERPNLVGGGFGLLYYTVEYERYLTHWLGLGSGVTGFVNLAPDAMTGTAFPVYVALTPIGDRNSLYLSGGVDIVVQSYGVWNKPPHWFGTGSLGYLLQTRDGFFLRPSFELKLNRDDGVLRLGITMGGSF
jgi:hypothetical protein